MPSFQVTTRRLKFWSRLLQAYFKRYRFKITFFIVSTVVLLGSLAAIFPKVSRTNVISIGYVGAYSIETIPTEILSLVTQSLISTDSSGNPVPSLASHWTISEDGKTYIVFLKGNLKWHDGTSVDTTNISIAISNVEITALNNKAIEFKLPNPIASFPQALNKPVFKTNTFYGTEEYKIVKIDQVEGLVKKIILNPKNTKLPIVEIRFYQSQDQVVNALKIGEVKSAKIASDENFANWKNLTSEQTVDYLQTVTLFFNTEDPNLTSKDLRQALIYAINNTSFNGQIANNPISKSSWAYNESVKQYSYNTGKSKELLSKLQTNQQEIKLSVLPGLEKVSESIKADWEAIGLKVTLENVKITPDNFQVLLGVNDLMPDPDQYALWHSTQTKTNITKYKDAKIDKLLEDARTTTDKEKRKELYFDFQENLVEDAPAAFLYHPYKYSVTYKNIKRFLDKLPKSESQR